MRSFTFRIYMRYLPFNNISLLQRHSNVSQGLFSVWLKKFWFEVSAVEHNAFCTDGSYCTKCYAIYNIASNLPAVS